MTPNKNAAWPFAYRTSCKPFMPDPSIDFAKDGAGLVVAAVVRVVESASVRDSAFGDGAFSIQFQCNDDDGVWSQLAFQFRPTDPNGPDFQIYEADSKTQGTTKIFDSTTNKVPKISGMNAGYAFEFQLISDGASLYGQGAVRDPTGAIMWQSGNAKFNRFGNPVDANCQIVGYGNGSYAQFASGRFLVQILASPGYDDLAFVQPNPWFAVPDATPCRPILFMTNETSNLRCAVEGGGRSIDFEASLVGDLE